jgi:hypothetical protein
MTSRLHRTKHGAGSALLVLLGAFAFLVSAATVPAAAGTTDFDGDGVADGADACPDTDPSDLAGPDGCTIVSCENGVDGSGWTSSRAYQAWVLDWVRAAKQAGTISAREGRAIVRAARKSTCGSDRVRCCVYDGFDDETGRCRITTEAVCEALDERLFEHDGEADDEGPGSCLPNPCAF